MTPLTNCYYCGYPLPPDSTLCPECGGGTRLSDPVNDVHRTTTNTWILLGLATLLLSLPLPIIMMAGPSNRNALFNSDDVFLYQAIIDALGISIGLVTLGWVVVAKRRTTKVPVFPPILFFSTAAYLVEKLVFFALMLLSLSP